MRNLFYKTCKTLGLFHLASYLTRKKLCIVCFHGFEISDESQFRPKLFTQVTRFDQRLTLIKRLGYQVLPLQEALQQLSAGTLPPKAMVLTIDDGFYSVLDKAAPVLKKHGFPSTLYVTSYYSKKPVPIFRLGVQYLFWKTRFRKTLSGEHNWLPSGGIDMSDTQQKETGMWQIIEYGEKHCTEDQRQHICHTLGDALDLDYDTIINSRALSLLTDVELRALESFGIDVQLHTHRHRFPPTDLEFCRREIQENRDYLAGVLGKQLTHFCYPSGVWNKNQWDLLDELNIESATTCEPGKNTKNTPILGLNRFLDEDDLPQIEFEAEIVGFKDLLRGVKNALPNR